MFAAGAGVGNLPPVNTTYCLFQFQFERLGLAAQGIMYLLPQSLMDIAFAFTRKVHLQSRCAAEKRG